MSKSAAYASRYAYGVAATSTLLKITGLFCKRDLQKRRYSAEETYDFKEPANCSRPIRAWLTSLTWCECVVCVCHVCVMCMYTHPHDTHTNWNNSLISICVYGVATISRLLEIAGLFCKRALQKRPIFLKETYNFKEATDRSHSIPHGTHKNWYNSLISICVCHMTRTN